ncbi:vitamin K epoxide reductase family protein [Microcoleus sp. FACHB-SPT15]|uniref:vitamin K epoxide reductase family protein n=1 Tax=Microcoleus sp. FACHB-SPT15 TaxID=2692830 RepID=UPI00177F5BAA|nr:vitamin K epoxide reductase family protein [Microcoleus sp. FACHB-SPT15]MBD1807363.1 vitamin K epoxide reductase family protein [Microcoleus sp. FACHB-SPT15]
MSRRRSAPWIHRWSRQLIGAIAAVGALLTAYLTIVKLTGGTAACTASAAASGASGCNDVLSSPYATVFGLPLALFGFLAYASMATFALAPLAVNVQQQKELRSKLEDWTWLLLFAGATAMTIFSGYLMYLLAFEIKTVCLYCIGSALFSLSMLVLTFIGRSWEDAGQLFFVGIIVGMVTLISALGVYANVGKPIATAAGGATPIPITALNEAPRAEIGGWEITTTSGEAEIALARHLKQVGAKAFFAYWCPHCYEQKQLFGKEALSELNAIECAADGKNGQPQVCAEAGVKGFPSWQINGELTSGTKTLEELADLTGYQGIRNFKYTLPTR